MFGKLRDSWVVWRRKVSEKFEKFNPEPKTEEMTVPVGVDSEGKLWTSGEGGGGGGGTTCYKIAWILTPSSAEDSGSFNLVFKPLVDYVIIDYAGQAEELTAGTQYTLKIRTGEDYGEVAYVFYGDMEINFGALPSLYVTEYSTTDVESGTDVSKAITVTEVTL